jgi:hypothetical protein
VELGSYSVFDLSLLIVMIVLVQVTEALKQPIMKRVKRQPNPAVARLTEMYKI